MLRLNSANFFTPIWLWGWCLMMFGYGGDVWWCLVMRWCLMMFGYWVMFDDVWLWGDVWWCLVIGWCLMMFGYGVMFDDVWLWGDVWWCLVTEWCLVRGYVCLPYIWKELGLGFRVWTIFPHMLCLKVSNLSFLPPPQPPIDKKDIHYTHEEDNHYLLYIM